VDGGNVKRWRRLGTKLSAFGGLGRDHFCGIAVSRQAGIGLDRYPGGILAPPNYLISPFI
jgi:hypothetical protein